MTKKTIDITLSSDWGDYRVPDPSGREAPAYYTDDEDDAVATADLMWVGAGACDQLEVRIRKVDAHPEGTKP